MTNEGIVLTPADDLNVGYRAFAIVNHAANQDNFLVSKSGFGFFRTGLETLTGPNFVANETGANNAIVGSIAGSDGTNPIGDPIALRNGLCVTVALAHTLQAGANTFNLNGLGAVAIRSHLNPVNNITTAYTATAYWQGCYNGTAWLDVSQ